MGQIVVLMFINEHNKYLLLKELEFILEKIDERLCEDKQNFHRWDSKKKILTFVRNRYLKDYEDVNLELSDKQKNEILKNSDYLKLKPLQFTDSKPQISLDRIKDRLQNIKNRKNGQADA